MIFNISKPLKFFFMDGFELSPVDPQITHMLSSVVL